MPVRQRQQEHSGYTVKTMLGYIRPCLERKREKGWQERRREREKVGGWAKVYLVFPKFSGF